MKTKNDSVSEAQIKQNILSIMQKFYEDFPREIRIKTESNPTVRGYELIYSDRWR